MENTSWVILLGGFALLYAYSIAHVIHPSIGGALLVLLLSGLYSVGWGFAGTDAAYSLAVVVVLAWGVYNATRLADVVAKGLGLLHGITLVSILGPWLFTFKPSLGIMGNPSMSGCLLVMTYPFVSVWIGERLWTWVGLPTLSVIALFSVQASVPIGMAAVGMGVFALTISPVWAAWAGGVLGIGLLLQGPKELFSSTGRFEFWWDTLSFWWHRGNHLFGFGLGSFPKLSALNGFTLGHPSFHWMHNDWAQLLFETGYVGLASVLVAFGFVMSRAWGRPILFASLACYASGAFFNFFAHSALTAFVGCALVGLTYAKPAALES
jgi:hypothetical protein